MPNLIWVLNHTKVKTVMDGNSFMFLIFYKWNKSHHLQFLSMCEQAAEAHKSKGAGHSSRKSRMSSDAGQINKSSVDAILSNSSSTLSTQVSSYLLPWLLLKFLLVGGFFFKCQLDNIVSHFSVLFFGRCVQFKHFKLCAEIWCRNSARVLFITLLRSPINDFIFWCTGPIFS